MKGLKIYIDEELEIKFRKLAMEVYGYRRGSISRAAEEAIRMWVAEHENLLSNVGGFKGSSGNNKRFIEESQKR